MLSYKDGGGAVLLRIDPQTNAVAETIPLDCVADLEPPECFAVNVAVDEDGVWVTLSADPGRGGEIVHIDPATSEIVARIPIDNGSPRDVVVGEGAVWVYVLGSAEGSSLVRIDPQTYGVTAILLRHQLLPAGGDEMPPVVAIGAGDVWVTREQLQGDSAPGETLAVRIDAQTNEVIGESQNLTPESGTSVFPFAVGEGGLWFFGGGDAGIRRLNAQTLQVDESVDLEGHAIDALLDPTAGTIWVASYEGPVIRIDLR